MAGEHCAANRTAQMTGRMTTIGSVMDHSIPALQPHTKNDIPPSTVGNLAAAEQVAPSVSLTSASNNGVN